MKAKVVFRRGAVLAFGMLGLSAAVGAEEIRFEIGTIQVIPNIRTGERTLNLHLVPTGIDRARVRAGRGVVVRAQDDTGLELKAAGEALFSHVSVGSVSGDNLSVTAKEPIVLHLTGPAPNARTVHVEATMELIVPDLDLLAQVTIVNIAGKFGQIVDSPALKAAGITLAIFDRKTCEELKDKPGGPQTYDDGPMFGALMRPPPQAMALPAMADAFKVKENDVVLGLFDPQGRLLSVEFHAADGDTLRYNHNGNYHSSGKGGKRCDIYSLPANRPPDVRLVCWLITEKATMRVPLRFADVALPAR